MLALYCIVSVNYGYVTLVRYHVTDMLKHYVSQIYGSPIRFGCLIQLFEYLFLFSEGSLKSLNRVKGDVQGDSDVHVNII